MVLTIQNRHHKSSIKMHREYFPPILRNLNWLITGDSFRANLRKSKLTNNRAEWNHNINQSKTGNIYMNWAFLTVKRINPKVTLFVLRCSKRIDRTKGVALECIMKIESKILTISCDIIYNYTYCCYYFDQKSFSCFFWIMFLMPPTILTCKEKVKSSFKQIIIIFFLGNRVKI
jgi:hypothetical protein